MVIISDTHGHHDKLTSFLPEGDILIHLGDFCNRGSTSDAMDFADWVTKMAAIPSNQKHPPKHGVGFGVRVSEIKRSKSNYLVNIFVSHRVVP